MIGTILSHYKILEKLGAGGMGVVYRAQDTTLERQVAIKFLPETLAADLESLARLEREAKLLASLNHPNIAAIHGLEQDQGKRILVLELVEGETLAQRLARGRLPLDEALEVCRQIAEGLEAAHDKSIIHRDLKPANIKITPGGRVKILDFGLAKAFPQQPLETTLSQSPTITEAMTQAGTVLGTAAYMSPEQASGKAIDKKTDVWAFGCILFECLTGRRAFQGETITEILASVIKGEPDWNALPKDTPEKLRALLRRCLQKNPKLRLHDVADARIEIGEPGGVPAEMAPVSRKPSFRWLLAGASIGLLAGALITGALIRYLRSPRPALATPAVVRFYAAAPSDAPLFLRGWPSVAISPDGTRLVYVAELTNPRDQTKYTQLFLRDMGALEARAVPDTIGARSPFFSADGRWIGFSAGEDLKKVSIHGGPALGICSAPAVRGASWSSDDSIIFAPSIDSGLSRVSAAGGTPEPVSTLDKGKKENTHRWPDVLPGGKAVLFTVRTAADVSFDDAHIAVLELESGRLKVLLQGSYGRYVPCGYIIYARSGALLAAPFDLKKLDVSGSVFPVQEGVFATAQSGMSQFAVSREGTLVYVPTENLKLENRLLWVDRKGSTKPFAEARIYQRIPAISPDGRRLAFGSLEGSNYHVFVYGLEDKRLIRLTFEGVNLDPVWAPDGTRIAFRSNRTGSHNIYWMRSDGSGEAERLTSGSQMHVPYSISSDGRLLAYTENNPVTKEDIWLLRLTDRAAEPFLRTPSSEGTPRFSADGRWLAYTSDESGSNEVYVRDIRGTGGKWQISNGGGVCPVWGHKTGEIYYRSKSNMMAVEFKSEPTFSAGPPRVLFRVQHREPALFVTPFDVTRDDQQFLMLEDTQHAAGSQINVTIGWFEEVKRLSAPRK